MKRLSVFLLLLGLVGCSYPSKYEAKDACKEWDNNILERSCETENETNQVLGIECCSNGKATVVKHFRYQ